MDFKFYLSADKAQFCGSNKSVTTLKFIMRSAQYYVYCVSPKRLNPALIGSHPRRRHIGGVRWSYMYIVHSIIRRQTKY